MYSGPWTLKPSRLGMVVDLLLSVYYFRTNTHLCKDLQQNGMRLPAVNDVGLLDTAGQGFQTAGHLGNHTTTDSPIVDELTALLYCNR